MSTSSMAPVPESFEMNADGEGECYSCPEQPPHHIEAAVSRALRESPGVCVNSLSIHQIEGGVCLHGVVEVDNPNFDIAEVVRSVLAIDQVINRMIVRHSRSPHYEFSESEIGFTGEWA